MTTNIISSSLPNPPLLAPTLSQLIYERLSTAPDSTQIIDSYLGRRWSKLQVLDTSLNFADYLRNHLCLGTGNVVFFITENSDIHAIAILGVLMAGCVYGSAPEHSTECEIRELVATVRPHLLICSEHNFEKIKAIFSEKPFLKTLLLANKSSALIDEQTLTVEKIFQMQRTNSGQLWPIETSLDSTVTLMMSSGTTGKPKAIIKTNRNHLSTISMFEDKELCPLTAQDIFLSSGFFHICGQRSLFSSINSSAQLVVCRCDETHEELFKSIIRYSVTTCVLIPTQLNFLVKNYNKFDKNSLKSLRDVLTGAVSLSAQTYKAIVDLYGFERFRNSYGMSESGFVLTVTLSDSNRLDNCETAGKVNPGMQLKIVNTNDIALPPNHFGEICIKGDQVSPGYLNGSQNKGLFTSDGFLKSGDIGYYDEKGFFFIVGRMKDIIKVDGVSVRPVELEHLLIGHKDVENAAVIGVKDDIRGEIPMAFVTLIEGSDISEDTLIDYVNSRVNEFKKIRAGVRILDKMPVTHSGKIRKSDLSSLSLI